MVYFQNAANFAVLLITLLCAVAGVAFVYFWVKDKRLVQLRAWVQIAVHAIEQEMKVDGPRKKEMALLLLRKIATNLGAKISDEQLSLMIEAAVYAMQNAGQFLEPEVAQALRKLLEGMEGKEVT